MYISKKTRINDSAIIAQAVVELLDPRRYLIVPNVYWGLNLNWEADLIVMDPSKRITEIEIKISKQDLIKDFTSKGNKHSIRSKGIKSGVSNTGGPVMITRMVFAVPEELLETALTHVPKQYGIIVVKRTPSNTDNVFDIVCASWHRQTRHPRDAPGVGANIESMLTRNLSIKYWSIRGKMLRQAMALAIATTMLLGCARTRTAILNDGTAIKVKLTNTRSGPLCTDTDGNPVPSWWIDRTTKQ